LEWLPAKYQSDFSRVKSTFGGFDHTFWKEGGRSQTFFVLAVVWLVQGSHLEKYSTQSFHLFEVVQSSRFHVQEGGERVPGQVAEVHGPGRGAGGEGALLAWEPRECNRQPLLLYETAHSESWAVNNEDKICEPAVRFIENDNDVYKVAVKEEKDTEDIAPWRNP
jgi:hypothetical protein